MKAKAVEIDYVGMKPYAEELLLPVTLSNEQRGLV
jgi:hypothetical protein